MTDFTGACIPYGFPLMEFFSIQLQFADGSFNVLTMDRFYRHVDLTRTSHPAGLSPGYDGDSIGHWEGDTLVIDTVGLRTDTLIELGLTHSPALHVLERLHKAGPDRLQVDYVFRDPVAFARDWHVTVTYDRTSNSLNTDAGEEPCQLNRNGLDAKGNIVFLGSDGKSLTDYK